MSKDIYKERIATDTDYVIEASIWYTKGDDYRTKRGYYVSVFPARIEGDFIIAECFSGYKALIMTVDRKSVKSDNIAIDRGKMMIQELVKRLCDDKHFNVKED